jgi:hypothetical protein
MAARWAAIRDADAMRRWLEAPIGRQPVEVCVGTGGDVEERGVLLKELLGADRQARRSAAALDALIGTGRRPSV